MRTMLDAAFPQIPACSTVNAVLQAKGTAVWKADLRNPSDYFFTKPQEMVYDLGSFPLFVLCSVAGSETQTHEFIHSRKVFHNRTPSMVPKVFLNRRRLK